MVHRDDAEATILRKTVQKMCDHPPDQFKTMANMMSSEKFSNRVGSFHNKYSNEY